MTFINQNKSVIIYTLIAVVMVYQGYEIRHLKQEVMGKVDEIVVIDSEKIIKETTIDLVKNTKTPEEAKEEIKKRIKRLEEGIESFKKKGLTVMEKRCIAGKTVDISEDIAKYMKGRNE